MTTLLEQWKSVVGYEGLYEVSNHGRIRALARIDASGHRRSAKIRKPNIVRAGYLRVHLRLNGKNKSLGVHRLVLAAFVGPCPDGMQACHSPDSNPANCRLDNLRWDTRENNYADRDAHGNTAKGERQGSSVLIRGDVWRIRDLFQCGVKQPVIANYFNVSEGAINHVVSGRSWSHV